VIIALHRQSILVTVIEISQCKVVANDEDVR